MYRMLLAVCLALACVAASALDLPIPVPKPPIPKPTIQVPIPGLDRLRSEGPWITTSLADVLTEVPFLDHYDPRVLTPLGEMPCSPTGEFLLAPGAYDFFCQSYCLHAGAYAPGAHGNGYVLAPLKGPGAQILDNLLQNSVAHPEIPQQEVQLLIWALLARTPVDKMAPSLQEAAQALLSREDLRQLQRGAAAIIPTDLVNVSFADLPEPVRRALEIENDLRTMFTNKITDYTEIAGVAVQTGDPPPSKEDREIPEGRWSFDPAGYFVAYVPVSYPETALQVSQPGGLIVERDQLGRLTSITGPRGERITTEYAGGISTTVPGDDGVQICPFRAIHLSATDRLHPAGVSTFDAANTGYTLLGLPSGRGTPVLSSAAVNLPDRYAWAVAHRAEVEQLLKTAAASAPAQVPEPVHKATLGQLSDLGNYAQALWQVLSAAAEENDQVDLLLANPAYEAWQALLIQYAQGEIEATAPGEGLRSSAPTSPFRLCLGFFGNGMPGAISTVPMAVYGRRELRPYRPSRGVATPGSTGRQRLSPSGRGLPWFKPRPRPKRNESTPNHQENHASKEVLERSKKVLDRFSKFTSFCDQLTGEAAMWIAGQIGGVADPRGHLLGGITDGIFSMAGDISQALGGDPPRPDFDQVATPQPVVYEPLPEGAGLPPEKLQAYNSMLAASTDLWSKLRAAQITRDRLGGAYLANDEPGIERQAAALINLKRQVGQAMLVLADRMEALIALTPEETFAQMIVSAEELQVRQDALRQAGMPTWRVESAQLLGLSEAELATLRERGLALTAGQFEGTYLEAAQGFIASLRECGLMWSTLPTAEGG